MNNQQSTIDDRQLDFDLIVVGGGIVGTTLASALHNSGLNICIIEAQTLAQAAAKKQAYALSILTGKILEGIGVWQDIFPHIGKFRHIRLSDADYAGIVKFETTDLGTEFLGYVAEHKFVLGALQNFTQHCSNITWLEGAQVKEVKYETSAARIRVQVGDEVKRLKTRLVVGADGARSRLRQEAGITTRGWKYWQSCVAFTIKHQAERNDIAFERFWQTGPMGVLYQVRSISYIART